MKRFFLVLTTLIFLAFSLSLDAQTRIRPDVQIQFAGSANQFLLSDATGALQYTVMSAGDGLNFATGTFSLAAAPATGGTTVQAYTFDDNTDSYVWTDVTTFNPALNIGNGLTGDADAAPLAVLPDPAAGNIVQVSAAGVLVPDIQIDAGSAQFMTYTAATRTLAVENLLITSVDVDAAAADLNAFVGTSYTTGTEYQEGDIIVLTTPGTAYINNGGTANDATDFTQIEAPGTSDAAIRALFSSANAAIDYNSTTGVFTFTPSTTANNELIVDANGAYVPAIKEDATFSIVDDLDNTKIIRFVADNIAAATTRTATMPDANVDLTPMQAATPGAGTTYLQHNGGVYSWQTVTQLGRFRQNFLGSTGATVTVTVNGGVVPASDDDIEVYRNGELQTVTADYTRSGAVITFVTALSAENVSVIFNL